MTTTLRELLNEAQWKTGHLHEWAVDVVHRGAPGDRRTVGGARIAHVLAAGVEVLGDASDSDTVFLPYHRFLQVRGTLGQVVWTKGVGFSALGLAAETAKKSGDAGGATIVASEQARPNDSHEDRHEVRHEVSVVAKGHRADEPLVIDGAAGEGGGQVLRSSLTLSMLTGRPVVIENIRGGRRKPGLMRQHLTGVQAAVQVCGAEVSGATLRSGRLSFTPGPVRSGDLDLAVGTAGSVALVLQTILIPLCLQPKQSRVSISGGTHARWAPPWPFLEESFLPLLARQGASIQAELKGAGFYPAGGGRIEVVAGGGAASEFGLGGLFLPQRRGARGLELTAVVSNLSETIARRELVAASELLADDSVRLNCQTLRSRGPGNAIWLTARGDEVTQVFTAIGESGTAAEEVGQACASQYLRWRDSDTSVDEHLADQLLVPMVLAGAGAFTTTELTKHAWTNIAVIEAFTGRRIEVFDLGEGRYRVELQAQH